MVKVSPIQTISPKFMPWKAALLVGLLASFAVILVCSAVVGVSPLKLEHLLWMLPLFGAVSNTAPAAIAGGRLVRTFTVTATADADTTTGAIAHGFLDENGAAVAPDVAILTPIDPAARISLWIETVRDATNVTFTKGTGVGSGAAPAQLRVTLIRFGTLIR